MEPCVNAVEILIVAKPNRDICRRLRRTGFAAAFNGWVSQELLMHTRKIAVDRLGPEGYGPIDPDPDLGRPSTLYVASESRWDFNRGRDLPALEPVLQIVRVLERRLLKKVARATQFFEVGPAHIGVVPIQRGKCQRVHVGRDAKPEDKHEEGGPEQGEAQSNWIAQELQKFADSVRQHSAYAKYF